MACSSKLLGRVAALSFLATIGCSSEHECPRDVQVGTAEGSIAFVNSASYRRAEAAYVATLDGGVDDFGIEYRPASAAGRLYVVTDARCQGTADGTADGCVEVSATLEISLAFRRPSGPGTYALRDLAAEVCESIPFVEYRGDPTSCANVDGTLVVDDVGSDHLEADLVLADPSGADADDATAHGRAHLSAHIETISAPCGGGCGNMPLLGLN